jgi:hypothetical protein
MGQRDGCLWKYLIERSDHFKRLALNTSHVVKAAIDGPASS